MALTVKKIARLGEGRYHDSNGLYLQVSAKGGKYWAFRYKRKGVEHWHGLGSWPAFSLEEARGRAGRQHNNSAMVSTLWNCGSRNVMRQPRKKPSA
jgi:hypothetical protein